MTSAFTQEPQAKSGIPASVISLLLLALALIAGGLFVWISGLVQDTVLSNPESLVTQVLSPLFWVVRLLVGFGIGTAVFFSLGGPHRRSDLPGFGNSVAVFLTTLVVLPALALFLFGLTSYIDVFIGNRPAFALDIYGRPTANQELYATLTKISFAVRGIIIAVLVSFSYYGITDWLNLRYSRIGNRDEVRMGAVQAVTQPWIFIGPAIVLLLLFLVIPAIFTGYIAFTEQVKGGTFFERSWSWANWNSVLFDPRETRFWNEKLLLALRNSLMWLTVVPTACIAFGLLIAVLADSVKWGVVAKAFIFVPMAISFVGAAVIWQNIFTDKGVDPYQVGLLNAVFRPLLAWIGSGPQFWNTIEFWGNFFLMFILVWIQTGFAMVIFSAALRGVPEDTIEAARMDGATPIQIFFRVKLPQIYSTVVVVWTTITILVLKVFDIPYALANNNDDKLLLATLMERAQNVDRNEGAAAVIVMMLLVAVIPIMIFNVWRMRQEEK